MHIQLLVTYADILFFLLHSLLYSVTRTMVMPDNETSTVLHKIVIFAA